MEFSPIALVVIGLVLAAWTVAAAIVMARASNQTRRNRALQTSFKRMQQMLDVAPAIPLLVRVDGKVEAPARLARWFGLERMPNYLSELVGDDASDPSIGLSSKQVDELTEAIRRTQKSAAPFRLALTTPGSGRSLALHGALADPQVSPGGAALVWVFDFTESEDELSQLRTTAARAQGDFAALVGLIEAAPVPMWFRAQDMKLQLVNRAYVEAVGASDADIVVKDQIELLESLDGKSPSEIARSTLTAQRKAERIVATTIHGERRTLRVSDLPIGQDGVAGYAIDIEEQEQQAREFRAFREAQRAMLDQLSIGVAQPMPDGGLVLIAEDRTEQLALSATRDTLLRTRTATLDSLFEALAIFAPDGSVQLWNRSFAGTWGLTSEFLDTHPSAEALLEAIAENLSKPAKAADIGAVVRAATLDRREKGGRIELKDGRTLEFAGIPLPDGNGLLTVLDITDSQKAEKALRERNQALEEADAVKTRFLANMSYEFRTPLTSIGGFAELIKSGAAGETNEQLSEYVDAILTSVARLTEQVENVLDLSQSEAGLLPINNEELDLVAFITKLVREREQVIVEAGLGLDLKGKRGRKVMADPRQLGRAVGNLLDNAIKGTPKGGHIQIDITKLKEGAEIHIADTGKGMTQDQLTQSLEGTSGGGDERRQGLGIPLAKQLIEAHGGTLELTSEPGKGTIALIRLP